MKRIDKAALVVIDVQNDFCPGGSLAVPRGDEVVPVINRLMPEFPFVVATQDWHPRNHVSFAEQGGPWPPHCIQNTYGAEPHPGLNTGEIDIWVKKDSPDTDAYSGFEAFDPQRRPFAEVLKLQDINTLYIVGLATDYCVRVTTLEALKKGYKVNLITDAIRAVNVNPEDGRKAIQEMENSGARLVTSAEVLSAGATGTSVGD
jgi:nicotinamidase/pyrazinamidase